MDSLPRLAIKLVFPVVNRLMLLWLQVPPTAPRTPYIGSLITVCSRTCQNSSSHTYPRSDDLTSYTEIGYLFTRLTFISHQTYICQQCIYMMVNVILHFVFQFFSHPRPQVHASLPLMYCSDRGAEYERLEWVGGGPRPLKQLFLSGLDGGGCGLELLHPRLATGLTALTLPNGWSHIHIPSMYTHPHTHTLTHTHTYTHTHTHLHTHTHSYTHTHPPTQIKRQ